MKTLLEWKCESKFRYKSKKRAWNAAFFYFTMKGTYSTPYKCPRCFKFHLTTKQAQPCPSIEFINKLDEWFGYKLE